MWASLKLLTAKEPSNSEKLELQESRVPKSRDHALSILSLICC